jgi:hypothetical protein
VINRAFQFATYLERFARNPTAQSAIMWLYRFKDRPKFVEREVWEEARDGVARVVGYVGQHDYLHDHSIPKFAEEAARFVHEEIGMLGLTGENEKEIARLTELLQDEEIKPYIEGEKPTWVRRK